MTCKVLKLFANTLSADDKYCVLSRDNLMQPIQMDLPQEQKTLSKLFCAFFISASNFQSFQTKMNLIAYVSPKLGTMKDVFR